MDNVVSGVTHGGNCCSRVRGLTEWSMV